MARRKASAHAVPASHAEARALIEDYVAHERQALRIWLEAELAIDAVKAARDALLAEYETAQKSWFEAIKAWWEAGGAAQIAGKHRSAKLAGARLGIRLTPPAVKFARGVKADAIIAWLGRVVGGAQFLRTKVELDKQAVIKIVQAQGPMAGPLGEQGVTVVQTDEFFIDAGLDPEAIRKELAAA